MNKPIFTIKNRFQKKTSAYADLLTPDILADVCRRITGRRDFRCVFDDEGYNKGRMAVLEYRGIKSFISFSETEASGRNSSFQSVPSALNAYYLDRAPKKNLYFYFLPTVGNYETNYFLFMYQLMMSAGIVFLNAEDYLSHQVAPFATIGDVIRSRNKNRGRNASNNSSYITRNEDGRIEIYGKTYGANKYETTLLAVALSRMTTEPIDLIQISEQDLNVLPEASQRVIEQIGNLHLRTSSITLEKRLFEDEDSLRSPRYIYNLLHKLGPKKCALCGCETPQLIQGAHIWPVARIKSDEHLCFEKKLQFATDGENGLWLCNNHHKMFDDNLIVIQSTGAIHCRAGLKQQDIEYFDWFTRMKKLPGAILTDQFKDYLSRRYAGVA